MKYRVRSSAEEKDLAEKYCQQLSQLTGMPFFVAMPEVHIALICDRQIFGYWHSWRDARKAIVACLLMAKLVQESNSGQDMSNYCQKGQNPRNLGQPMDEEFQGQLKAEGEILQQAIRHIFKERFEDELK